MADDNFGSLREDDELVGLRKSLDDVALGIIEQGDSDLVFGGSSEQEAQVFGAQINSSDAPKVGAFLGGVALANLKVQQQRQQRLNRINKVQDRLLKESLNKSSLATGILQERIEQSGANARNTEDNQTSLIQGSRNNAVSLEKTRINETGQNARNQATLATRVSEGAADRANRTRNARISASNRKSSGNSAAEKEAKRQRQLAAETIIAEGKEAGIVFEDQLPRSDVGREATAARLGPLLKLRAAATQRGIEIEDEDTTATIQQKIIAAENAKK